MRQAWERHEDARMVGETGKSAEDLQGAAIGYGISGILYGEMLDISKVGRWEKVDCFVW